MLLDMTQSNQFNLVASWVVPSRQGGMDFTGAHSIWKCMVMPSQVSMDDTCKFFFECTVGNHGQGTLYHPNLHSGMETKVLEEYVHFFTCEKDQVF